MSFIEGGRFVPKIDVNTNDKERIKQLEQIIVIIEEWFNDIFRVINANAGSAEAVDLYTDLPPVSEAVGRVYFLMDPTGAPGGKRFFGSDGAAWLPFD